MPSRGHPYAANVSSFPRLEQDVYQDLRERLVDRTRRNRLLHFKHTTKTTMLRIIDEAPDIVLRKLQNDGKLRFKPLPDPDDEPADEQTLKFRAALKAARVTDEAYRDALAAIDPEDPAATAKEDRLERELRDRLRIELNLPARPQRRTLDLATHARNNGIDPAFDLAPPQEPAPAKHRDDWLQTLLLPDQMKTRVNGLARKAREVEQETGVSTLHLAFGFLDWFEADSSETAFSSPLLLLPVALERHRIKGGEEEFRLFALDEAPVTNLSLELRLRDDFKLSLPAFDPAEDGVESYLAKVADVVRHLKRSRIRRYMTMAPFSFARIAMYRDLDLANWRGISPSGAPGHALVRPLLRGVSDDSGGAQFAEEFDIDDPDIEKLAPILVSDADSSQHSAIVDVMKGRNLVIEGPPGTGKSQTIANLIANVLHRGGRVLFVAEKMAALDVVKSRLDRVGLGHFCLSLHASGAKPSAVVEALKEREGIVAPQITQAGTAAMNQAKRARTEINGHLATLHAEVGPLGETAHRYIGRLAELTRVLPHLPSLLRAGASRLPPEMSDMDIADAKQALEALEAASRSAEAQGVSVATSPFRIMDRADLFPDERDALIDGLQALEGACALLAAASADLAKGLNRSSSDASLSDALRMVEAVEELKDPGPEVDRCFVASLSTREAIASANWLLENIESLGTAASRLRKFGISDPAALDVGSVRVALDAGVALGVTPLTITDVVAQAAEASRNEAAWRAHSLTLREIASLLDLSENLDVAAVRLICKAVEIAAAAGPEWRGVFKPGLDRHLIVLEEAAHRHAAIQARRRDASVKLDLNGAGATALRNAAASLESPGWFGFLKADVRDAKTLFRQRWRGGAQPSGQFWAKELRGAAAVLSEEDTFYDDAALRAALEGRMEPKTAPIAQLAEAAKWQRQALTGLASSNVEIASLASTVVEADAAKMGQLAALAEPGRALAAFLQEHGLQAEAPWSVAREGALARGQALANLGTAISQTGLVGDIQLSSFSEIGDAHGAWKAAATALASEQAAPMLAFPGFTPSMARAGVGFAQDVISRHAEMGLFLLTDGWTDRIQTMRELAATTRRAATAMTTILDELALIGLGTFCGGVPAHPAPSIAASAASLLSARATLPAYLDFAINRNGCVESPIAAQVLRAYEAAAAALHHLPEALEWLVAWRIVRRQAESNTFVFHRTGDQLSTFRQHFAEADRSRLASDAKLTQRAVLGRHVPSGSSAGSRKEWTGNALLQNEFSKQRRHVPVRDLLNRAGEAVLALTPCLMMSPLTVAQYLKPGGVKFDLVVMDEASQIKPEDAIGAMLRGQQAVVVGDPKQLPPTNFFDRALGDDGEDEESGGDDEAPRLSAADRVAAESVLDLAARAFRPARRLRWHYRSQHESLIAFSNREFYGNNLVVFPSAHAPSDTLGIELVQVGGIWRDRVNQEEAKAVAAAAAAFMRNHPKLSLGVVAMNQPQRELIHAEIELLISSDIALSSYADYWEERLEPFFVKNLENVQGDERDVIFISLGWGRTPEGALHQRFYPVNRREDGHRRLNVLFTRAKRKIVLFSSVEPEEILVDAERTSPGVRILREYLSYARDGRLEQGEGGDGSADSPFETSVANAMRALGHDVALQVGVAGYRIDIAARHPSQPARFVLGIECDGAAYHSAKSARDRDRLRQEALERLGWNLIRVWSTDWFRDPAAQARRISTAIERATAATDLDDRRRPRLVEDGRDQRDKPTQPAGRSVTVRRGEAAKPEMPVLELGLAPAAEKEVIEAASPRSLPEALRALRRDVIMRDFPGSEPGRCILREDMIAAIIKSGLDDPEDFLRKIPEYLRSRTDGRQVVYLDRICHVVAAQSEDVFAGDRPAQIRKLE